MKKSALLASIILSLGSAFATDENGWASTYESLSAFQKSPVSKDGTLNPYANRPSYVKPIIDNLGNVLNSNWYVSASVPQSFTFEAGLPISIISIDSDDRNYTENAEILGQSIAYETPTIFGEHRDMTQADDGRIYGNKTLNGLGVFTYPYIQLGASFYHARVVFRGMFLPSISELTKFNLFGFGLRYSFGHFFQYMLPPAAQPLDVSIVFGYNTSGIGYRPEDYEGELNLDVSTTNFAFVIGYKPVSFIEVMMSLGYQSAEMKSSGHLKCVAKEFGNPDYGATIDPDITVEGNNGFRFGLEIAFQLGKSFHPVVGFDYAGKSSWTTNVLYFKQQFGEDKTPNEIAKEKGYVRGGNTQTQSNDAAETSAVSEEEPTNEAPEEYADEQVEEPSEPAEDNSADDSSADNTFDEE